MTPGTTRVDAAGPAEDAPDARARPPAHARRVEYCETCAAETPHEVRAELRTESARRENAASPREPYTA